MIGQVINHIQVELSKRHRTRDEVIASVVSERLNKSLETYRDELTKSVKYISPKNELNVFRKL